MINSKVNNNELVNKMQSPIAMKKIALRDVQNGNRSMISNLSKNTHALERRLYPDTIKFSGTKRVAPECIPSNLSLTRNGASEYLINGKLESEKCKQNVQGNPDRNIDNLQLGQIYTKQQDIPQPQYQINHIEDAFEQQRKKRFLHLQQLLKHIDESDHSENIQRMMHLSPTELSREAVELEKRSIHLTIEEGKEIKRMMELNVLPTAQHNHPKK